MKCHHYSRVIAAVLLLSAATIAAAHPFHITSGEAQLDRSTGNLEVSIELNPSELEQALELRFGNKVDIDSAEALVARYAREVFVFEGVSTEPEFHWVGMELEVATGWLHFEFKGVAEIDGAIIENRFLVEVAESLDNQQMNTVRFRVKSPPLAGQSLAKPWRSITFTAPDYRQSLDSTDP